MKTAYILVTLGLMIAACGPAPTPAPTSPFGPATDVPPTQPVLIDTPAASEEQATVPVVDVDTPPSELMANVLAHAGQVRRNITYCTAAQVELKLDVYSPRRIAGATPLVIFIHGGGWSKGDKVGGEYLFDTPALLEAGYTFASLNYRLAPENRFPAMIEDVKCAIRFFRAHAGDYEIDPDRIGVWGTSAGGHLANLVGTTDASAGFEVGDYLEHSSRVQAVVDMYGPADLTVDFSKAFIELKDSVFGDFDLAQASPLTYVTPDDPPFLILQGDRDPVVPVSQSQAFYDGLAASGVEAQLVIVQGGQHGFYLAPDQSPSRAELSTMILEFFAAHLRQGR